ncbi:MAG: class I adenylate-forming enzyme family protein [Nocardioidaceae bacterium]|nr:class I adenylate-forming enzyme family protein [Nocardioidaceae bacterium]
MPPLPDAAPWRTMADLVDAAAGRGSQPWLTATSADGRTRTVTYGELPDLVGRAAELLRAHGVRPGMLVGLEFDNRFGFEALVLHHAVHWCGGVVVPVNARFSERELRAVAVDADLGVLCTAGDLRGVASMAIDGLDTRLLDLSDGLVRMVRDLVPGRRAPVSEHDVADLLYTSGTSGTPKGVEITHASCVAGGLELVHAYGVRPGDVYQSAVPYFSSTGAHTNPFAALCGGAHLVLQPSFDQHDTIEVMRRFGTTIYFGVPSMYLLLLRDVDLSDLPDTLRTLVTGGSVMTADGVARIHAAFPGRGLINSYGQTEAGPGGTVVGPDDIADKPESVGGRGNGPWTTFRVARPDGVETDVEETGEIQLRSPAVMRGYRGRPEETATTLVDGWLRTGDLGRRDADGYLFYVDRMADSVIRGGFNVSTVEVESVLASHPEVHEAAVVGIEHAVLGEDLKAFVVADPGLDTEAVGRFLVDKLADYKIPRTIVVVAGLPRNAMGKVVKARLNDPDPGSGRGRIRTHTGEDQR